MCIDASRNAYKTLIKVIMDNEQLGTYVLVKGNNETDICGVFVRMLNDFRCLGRAECLGFLITEINV
jgi:hypothetical protein